MKKILLFITTGLVAFASIFTFTNIGITNADAIEGNAGVDTVLSTMSYFYLKNNTTDNIKFQSSDYTQGTLTNTFGFSGTNCLTADFGASLDYKYNKGWQYIVGNSAEAGVMRKSQAFIDFSSVPTGQTLSTLFSFYANFNANWSGTVSFQLPLFMWQDIYDVNTGYSDVVDTPVTIPSSFYGSAYGFYRDNGVSNDLTYTRSVRGNYIYFDAVIPAGTKLTSLSFYYHFNINTSELSPGRYIRYYFTNLYMLNYDESAYNQGYSEGYNYGINNINPNTTNYQAGYNAGINYANNTIYTNSASYDAGYNAGLSDSSVLTGIFGGVLEAPVNVVLTALDFEIFGIDVSTFVLSLLTIGFVSIIFKLLL